MSTDTMEQHALAEGKTFAWHEVYAPDAQKSVDFYTKALGFGVQEMDMGEMGTYKMLTKDGAAVAGIQGTSDNPEMKDVPPHWSTYLSVDNCDESLAKCVEHGATALHGPFDIPTVGRMVLISDPQGAHIWLFQPSEK